MPNTSLREATPTTSLRDAVRIRSVQVPNAQIQQSSTKISNNLVVQALHLKEIYVTPSVWRAVFQ
ncbi:hypothetical protein [Nostoc sp.]|uniref:hypothetical protein n=1 Tax=Nostoc sp. TaxID=1180 RepID=UPI002FF9D52A